jgi:hypothetical protein
MEYRWKGVIASQEMSNDCCSSSPPFAITSFCHAVSSFIAQWKVRVRNRSEFTDNKKKESFKGGKS